MDKEVGRKINRNAKIAIGLAAFTVVALVMSVFLGDFGQIAPGAVVMLAICYYFYRKRYEPNKKRVKKKKVSEPRPLSYGNPPTNEPIAPGLEVDINPSDRLLRLLRNDSGYNSGDRWQGLSLKEVRDDLETGYIDYIFEYDPWDSQGIINCPIEELEEVENFEVYLDGEEKASSFMGYIDPIYADDVRKALIEGQGLASVYFYVYGGKCMFMNGITKEIETIDEDFQYLVRLES